MHNKLLTTSVRRHALIALALTAVLFALAGWPGAALAQDGSAPDAPAMPRLYLPAMLNAAGGGAAMSGSSVSAADADGNVDGEWSYPRSDLNQSPVTCEDINNSPGDPTNENIVRYGQPISAADCGNVVFRSGFGF
ncbi:MAG: hypothetical protein KDE01_24685, partial [Caldilineaceae bacterium]|nr:hypothetical protein [Caldilineaceae bacterium]